MLPCWRITLFSTTHTSLGPVEPRHAKRALTSFFEKINIVLFSLMYIILRLVSEIVKISFPLDLKHGVYAEASFSANVTS